MGFFSNLRLATFYTKCKIACVKHGISQRNSQQLVELAYDVLTDCFRQGIEPDAAVAYLCGSIIASPSQIHRDIIADARMYTSSFIAENPFRPEAQKIIQIATVAKSERNAPKEMPIRNEAISVSQENLKETSSAQCVEDEIEIECRRCGYLHRKTSTNRFCPKCGF